MGDNKNFISLKWTLKDKIYHGINSLMNFCVKYRHQIFWFFNGLIIGLGIGFGFYIDLLLLGNFLIYFFVDDFTKRKREIKL